MSPSAGRFASWAVLAAALLHIVLGLFMIPLVGPQQDEALFASGILTPVYVSSASEQNPDRPYMLMPYIGALKIWLYKAVFRVATPDLWSLRVPVLLIGAISVWLTFLVGRRFLPAPFAAMAAMLVAVDPVFLLTRVFDWGPVALQHLLALLMVLAAMRAHETGRWGCAFGAGLCCGLGVWDKATFLWLLPGLVAALLVLWPREFLLSWRRPRLLAAALAGAALGSFVFVRYNLRFDMATFRASQGYDFADIPNKLIVLWFSLDGRGLLDFILNISGLSALPPGSWQGYAAVAALLLIPFLGAFRRNALALAAAFAVTYLIMASMRNAGGSVHHVVLLWPLPQLLIATAAAALASFGERRAKLAWTSASLVALTSLALMVFHIHLARSAGPSSQWTLASQELTLTLKRLNPRAIFVVDWGILSPLRLLGGGSLPIVPGSDAVAAEIERSTGDPRLEMLKDPRVVVVNHARDKMLFTDLNGRMDKWAASQGLTRTPVEDVRDRWGVTQFEIYRYTPMPRPEPPRR